MRVGIGYDIHALKKGRPLVLGGVRIPYRKGLAGHSDADALMHAVCDAVLGALAQGDLGGHFPDNDPRFERAASGLFAKKIKGLLARKGLRVAHIDAVVVAQAPKLAPYRERMRRGIADAFGSALGQVSVKAKTNEGFGYLGRGQAVACWAVASLARRKAKIR